MGLQLREGASHARRRAEGSLEEERCAAPARARRLRCPAARCRRRRLAARRRRRRRRLAAARGPCCSLLLAVGRGEVGDDDGAPPRDQARQRAWPTARRGGRLEPCDGGVGQERPQRAQRAQPERVGDEHVIRTVAPAPPRRARERRGGRRHARRVLGARAGASEQTDVRVDRHHEERCEPGVKRPRGVRSQLVQHRYLGALIVERPARNALGQRGVVKHGVLVDVKGRGGCDHGVVWRWKLGHARSSHVERRSVLLLVPSLLGSGAAA